MLQKLSLVEEDSKRKNKEIYLNTRILGDKTGYLQTERRRFHSDYINRNKNCVYELYLLIKNTLKLLVCSN